MRRSLTTREYIEDRIERDEHTGCWMWLGHRNGDGYGVALRGGKQKYVHRLAYEEFVGPIAPGLVIDHICRTRACCNPEHLEPVTHTTNILRGESPWAKKARKTHCAKGHPFDLFNTIWVTGKNGRTHRACRECKSESVRAWFAAHRPPPLDRTQCKRGHPRTPENGSLDSRGCWVCRVCKRDHAREAKRMKGAKPWAQKRAEQTHCPHGHEYTAANTYWYERDGGRYRYCRECNRAAARTRQAARRRRSAPETRAPCTRRRPRARSCIRRRPAGQRC